MSRLIFFGCSFTQYGWPTWANVIGYDQGIEYHNFGVAGLGNVGILHRMIEANAKLKFTDEDKIFILWSSWSREDRVRDQNWVAAGSIFNANNPEYSNYYIKRYWSFHNDIVKNATAIKIANDLFQKNIAWQGSAFEIATNEAYMTKADKGSTELWEFYSKMLPELPVLLFELGNLERPFGIIPDCHPDIKGHLSIVRDWVYPQLGLTLKQTTIDLFDELQLNVENYVKTIYKPDIPKTIDYFNRLVELKYSKIFDNLTDHYNIVENWY
jgi:hypothetical protein